MREGKLFYSTVHISTTAWCLHHVWCLEINFWMNWLMMTIVSWLKCLYWIYPDLIQSPKCSFCVYFQVNLPSVNLCPQPLRHHMFRPSTDPYCTYILLYLDYCHTILLIQKYFKLHKKREHITTLEFPTVPAQGWAGMCYKKTGWVDKVKWNQMDLFVII